MPQKALNLRWVVNNIFSNSEFKDCAIEALTGLRKNPEISDWSYNVLISCLTQEASHEKQWVEV